MDTSLPVYHTLNIVDNTPIHSALGRVDGVFFWLPYPDT